MNILPKDVQKLVGQYRSENQFLQHFIQTYYLYEINAIDSKPPNQKELTDLLQLNNLNSKFIFEQKNGMNKVKFIMDNEDLVTLDVIKQFMLLILPFLFNRMLVDEEEGYKNNILNRINFELRKFDIGLAIVGTYTGQYRDTPLEFYLFDGKNNIKIDI